MKKRTVALVLSLVLVLGVAVGGTIAWLTATTGEVVNTFTVGNIDITLAETTGETYKMVPGNEIAKDPKVTVEAGSEACWLFVEVTESENLDDFLTYFVASGWLPLAEEDGVYYREVAADANNDQSFYVLAGTTTNKNGAVVVKDAVEKDDMDALEAEGATLPTLSFKAYAVQKDNVATAAAAWAKAKPAAE